MQDNKRGIPEKLTRRGALTVFLGAGATLALGCSSGAASDAGDGGSTGGGAGDTDAGSGGGTSTGGSTGSGGASGGTGGQAGTGDAGACEVTPEGEIGPYFSDDGDARFDRSDIVANIDGSNEQDGIPLTLTVTVVDTEKSCAPYVNAQVDIWHCNAEGIYSDQDVENTATETWLRGYQKTDANGQVTFKTVIPGWYQGRTTHIHLRVRSTYSTASSTSDGTNTTQLFFDQDFVDTLATSVAPYNAEGKNSTTNASDHVYSGETNGANLLTVTGNDTKGYVATAVIALPITNEATTTSMGPGGMGGPPGM
jgi:protocatechuate 3,4-dioxygenase beta subunit